jgi:hypothetical protein
MYPQPTALHMQTILIYIYTHTHIYICIHTQKKIKHTHTYKQTGSQRFVSILLYAALKEPPPANQRQTFTLKCTAPPTWPLTMDMLYIKAKSTTMPQREHLLRESIGRWCVCAPGFVCVCVHLYTYIQLYAHVYIFLWDVIFICVYVYVHSCVCWCVHACIHTYIHTYTCSQDKVELPMTQNQKADADSESESIDRLITQNQKAAIHEDGVHTCIYTCMSIFTYTHTYV